jgi:hypothetical protein
LVVIWSRARSARSWKNWLQAPFGTRPSAWEKRRISSFAFVSGRRTISRETGGLGLRGRGIVMTGDNGWIIPGINLTVNPGTVT